MSIDSAQKTIEQKVLEYGLISENQYKEVKRTQIERGISFEDALISENILSEEQLIKLKSEITGIPFVDPTEMVIKPEAIKLVPETTARKYSIIPTAIDDRYIYVAMTDPDDLEVIEFIERSSKLRVKPQYSTQHLIQTAIDKEYSKSLGKGVTEAIEQVTETSATKMQETLKNMDEAETIIKVSPVAKIVSVILEYAVKSGASDIHIEPFENNTRIRYRIDGILQEKFPLPKSIHDSIVARIKILANMKIDEKRKPLDGQFKVMFGDKTTDLRVSTIPTVFGEKVVIRLLKDQGKTLSFADLGLWGKSLVQFEKSIKETTGIILVTGPTGSGKTVTLATSLSKLNSVKVNIVTLEDPVEIHIPGVNQIQVNPQAGLTFANGLRSILRQDPNIIMVGEIRDGETAQLAIQAALTGHLVLATLHTNSVAGAIPRLIDMGVENFLIASTLNILLAQRLTRRVCQYCKEAYEPDEGLKKDILKVLGPKLLKLGVNESPFNQDDDGHIHVKKDLELDYSEEITKEQANEFLNNIKLYKGKGCDRCNQTGYSGRIGLFEVLEIEENIRKLAMKKSSTEEIQKVALENGMITLVQDGYLKALWGITTIEEVLTVASTTI